MSLMAMPLDELKILIQEVVKEQKAEQESIKKAKGS